MGLIGGQQGPKGWHCPGALSRQLGQTPPARSELLSQVQSVQRPGSIPQSDWDAVQPGPARDRLQS